MILAGISAISDAFQNLFRKKQVTKLDPISLNWLLFLFASIAFLPFLKLAPDELSSLFWTVLIARTILDTFASYLFLRSVEISDLSLSVPLTAFTPIFILLFEFLLTGSVPSVFGVLGVVMIALGAYFLNTGESYAGLLSPLKRILKDKGLFFMLCVALIWSLTSTLHRVAIGESNAYFYLSAGSIMLLISFTTLLLIIRRERAFNFLSPTVARDNLPAGLFGIITNLSQMVAQGMFLASYVIAVKRTSILFSSILGGIFLREKIKARILPTVAIVLGIIVLTLTR